MIPKRTFILVFAIACGGGDDGGGDGDGDGDGDGTPTAFRISTLSLRDPHTFAFGGSVDVTGTVNGLIVDAVTMDGDDPPDGLLDLSILVVFQPLDQDGVSSPIEVVFADCTAPADSTSCVPEADTEPVAATATNDGADPCLEPSADTTSGYDPAIELPAAPCFASDAVAFEVELGGIVLPFEDASIAGTYDGAPAERIATGLIRGFVSEETADMALIPEDVAIVGGDPVSSLLLEADMDTGPGDVVGWYFYLNYEAVAVPYTP
jgi:hypothetical protein